ncbi:MAG TPA: hypothetical protein VK859_01980, partial [bacterium]|nr:hypothetical protein [bacterium]
MKKYLLGLLLLFPTLNLLADEAPDFYQQALNFYLANHYQNAVENLQIYFQGNPDDWKAHQLMGYCDYLLKNGGQALEECQKSLKLHGDNPRLEAFVEWLKSPEPRAQRKSDTRAYLEGSEAAPMPPPPDTDPDRKPDSYLVSGIAAPSTSSPTLSSSPTPKPDDIFFLRTGVGTYLLQFFFDDYNRPDVNGIPAEVDRYDDPLIGLTASAAGGFECPDHFSYFASGEWLTNDWSLMVNAQYTFSQLKIIKPYLYTGLGLNFERNNSIGPGVQVGLGAYLTLTENCDVFLESKFYGALGDLISAHNSTLSYSWADGYIPVLAGLKWSFPGKNQVEEPTAGANAPGHAFVEIAGGIDVPGSNWQSAYSPSAGEKFTAGFD